ncbi:MAG: rod shape-determining protein MreC [Planctomycetota bacterium]|nr:rod shape-determining protein MreC [Planctomycetota bacterium]
MLLTLMLFLVPEAHVASLRGHSLSALSPLLRFFGAYGKSRAPQPALLAVEVPAPPPQRPKPETPGTGNYAAELDWLHSENIRLRSELERLRKAMPGQGDAAGHAAPALPKLPPSIGADVIARKMLWQEPCLGLNRGAAEGVRLHAGVLHRGAVAGRIISVGPHASVVALLTHRGMSIAARLAESRIEGVLQGSRDEGDERLCRMSVVGREIAAKAGEDVVTSGYDGAFPPGLWLGVVVSAQKKGDVQWELAVRPACNENAVECVQILVMSVPEVPWPTMPERNRR